jgi:hypothetical protein
MNHSMVDIAKNLFRPRPAPDDLPKPVGRGAVQGRIILPNGGTFNTLRRDVFDTALTRLKEG